MIHQDILNRSMQITQEILNESPNLRGAGAKAVYSDRDTFLQQLVGENGHITFHPEVTDEITEPFKSHLKDGIDTLRDAYYNARFGADSEIKRFRFYVVDILRDNITTGHLLQNTVPQPVLDYVKDNADSRYNISELVKEARQYTSPKLSKLLVKLFGEQHEVVKWYTCKCPKQLSKGVLEEWTITLSTLPHHIAGMSYYGSYNWGGKRWREGYEGTSCMDTKRNGMGGGVFQLIPSLKDETMAVAYLSYASDSDIWQPIYQARCLVRVVYINGAPHLIACRPYFISNEATHILIDGLKNKFGNVHFVRDMRQFKDTEWVTFEHVYSDDIMYSVDAEIECEHCDGEGHRGLDEWGDPISCERCHGEGTWTINDDFLPYIDDGDFIKVYSDKMIFSLPTGYLQSVGVIETEQEQEEELPIMEQEEAVEIAAVRPIHDEVIINLENAHINTEVLFRMLMEAPIIDMEEARRAFGLVERVPQGVAD